MRRLARVVMVVGIFAVVLGIRALHTATRGDVGGLSPYLWFAATLAVVALAIGLPDVPDDWQPAIFSSILAALIGAGLFAVTRLFTPEVLPRFVLIVATVAVVPWYVACWRLSEKTHQRSRSLERVLALASAKDTAILEIDAVQRFPVPEVPFTLVRALTPSELAPGDLGALVADEHITLVVVGTAAQADDDLMSEIEQIHRSGVRVRTLEMFYDEWLGKLPLSEVGRMALLTDIGGLHDPQYASLKRVIDITFAVIGTLALALVTPFVLLGNLFGNRGPLLYTQPRTGRDDQPFRILKFRTMTPDPERATYRTVPSDPRVTPFGNVLRRAHLDELPQVLNVLRGSLSIVGPRPEQVSIVRELEEKFSYYRLRHTVKPGITGWAQVKFRYGADDHEAWEKLQYDLYYIRHQSLTFDLKIISRTVRQVAFAQGR
jgi:lipopolysaccharide/colanic/teichoic acid biosynthesis glycosyltransferase